MIKYLITVLIFLSSSCAFAGTHAHIDQNKLANAIYKAEGGAKTRHPYGILGHWNKPPRIICINTIKNALKRWNGQGDFIAFLAKRYCPVGASNDPGGLNRNWIKNVTYYYERG